jgi:hypothetical protein
MTIKEVQDLVTAFGTMLSGSAAVIGIYVAFTVHKNQKLLAQRQLIMPLWEYMASLTKFDPNNPSTPIAVKNVNTLELVAVCCEGGMVDGAIIRRTFSDQFMERYEEIERCQNVPGLNIPGKKLLNENRSAVEFYKKLDEERLSRNRINPV